LVMRLALARVFFLDGQSKVDGPHLQFNLHGFDFSFVLPFQVKAETFTAFFSQFAALPVPPMLSAYLVSYAEFLLPIMLVLGFGTRIAALGLLIVTVLMQLYVMPQALWSAHVYWASMLLVLLSLGPGQLSVDHFFRLAAND
jgi:putative oxidoreductase